MDPHYKQSFREFISSKGSRIDLGFGALLFLLSYAFLLWIYPFPNVYADTGAYIAVARNGEIGNFRPAGYSWFMALAHAIHPDTEVLVFLQTLIYFSSTLALFLALRYFFPRGSNLAWRIFLVVFLLSPVCLLLCNFVISDCLFISFTNLWLTTLFFIVAKKSRTAFIWNCIFLLLLILVRYIGLFYPLLTVIALFIAYWKNSKARFFIYTAVQAALFFAIILITTWETKRNIGVATFSGFSGWQKANNAMHIVPYINLKPEDIEDPEIRKVHSIILNRTAADVYPWRGDTVVVSFLWSPWAGPKQYMFSLQGKKNRPYLYYWHLASVPLGRWADYIIKKYPGLYLKHYFIPNADNLLHMSNEALFIFPGPTQEMRVWFECNNCEYAPRYTFFHDFMAKFSSKSFNLLWALLIISLIVLSLPALRSPLHFDRQQLQILFLVCFFCILYTLMSVYASPIVLRYLLVIRHSLILIPFIVLIYLLPARRSFK